MLVHQRIFGGPVSSHHFCPPPRRSCLRGLWPSAMPSARRPARRAPRIAASIACTSSARRLAWRIRGGRRVFQRWKTRLFLGSLVPHFDSFSLGNDVNQCLGKSCRPWSNEAVGRLIEGAILIVNYQYRGIYHIPPTVINQHNSLLINPGLTLVAIFIEKLMLIL